MQADGTEEDGIMNDLQQAFQNVLEAINPEGNEEDLIGVDEHIHEITTSDNISNRVVDEVSYIHVEETENEPSSSPVIDTTSLPAPRRRRSPSPSRRNWTRATVATLQNHADSESELEPTELVKDGDESEPKRTSSSVWTIVNAAMASDTATHDPTLPGFMSSWQTKPEDDPMCAHLQPVKSALQALHVVLKSLRDHPLSDDERLEVAYCQWYALNESCAELAKHARYYDASPTLPYNGIRSLLYVVKRLADDLAVAAWVSLDRRPPRPTQKFLDLLAIMSRLGKVLSIACVLVSNLDKQSLFLSTSPKDQEVTQLALQSSRTIDMTPFFGRQFGFFYPADLRNILQKVLQGCCAFYQSYKRTGHTDIGIVGLGSSIVGFSLNPEATSRVFVEALDCVDIGFLKGFWNLPDNLPGAQAAGLMVSQTMLDTNTLLTLPVEELVVEGRHGAETGRILPLVLFGCIPEYEKLASSISNPPKKSRFHRKSQPSKTQQILGEETLRTPDSNLTKSADSGSQSSLETKKMSDDGWELLDSAEFSSFTNIKIRVLSHQKHKGQISSVDSMSYGRSKGKPPSPSLLVHFHGGGFVGQSSKSHEIYLRRWARETGAVIVSVDYTLAPEGQHPRMVNEAFYAYCWVVSNYPKLGTKAERLVVAGDSAGANLAICVALRAIDADVRVPDAILACYPALLLQPRASPSRLIGSFDVVVPHQILMEVLDAYIGVDTVSLMNDMSSAEYEILSDPYLSPMLANESNLRKLPTIHIVAAGLDPLLDDSVQFARRLQGLGVDVHLQVEQELSHGFLNFYGLAGGPVRSANEYCIKCLRDAFRNSIGKEIATEAAFVVPESKQHSMLGPHSKNDSLDTSTKTVSIQF